MGLASAANKPAALSKKGIVSIAIYIDDSVAMNKKERLSGLQTAQLVTASISGV